MTTAIFLFVIVSFVITVLNILPDMPVTSTDFASSLADMVGYLRAFDFILPVNVILTCVGLIISEIVALYLLKVVKWLIAISRGAGVAE